MAIQLDVTEDDNTIKVIASIDSAIECSPEVYQDYLESLDESLLNIDPTAEPVRFVVKKMFNELERQAVNKSKITTGKRGKPEANLDYLIEEMSIALVGIEDPSGKLRAVFDSRGRCDRDLLSKLDQAGVLNDLHTARSNSFKVGGRGPLKKS